MKKWTVFMHVTLANVRCMYWATTNQQRLKPHNFYMQDLSPLCFVKIQGIQCTVCWESYNTSLVPRLAVRKSGRGPGIFSHVSDVRIERVVERVWLCVGALGSEQRKQPRYKVAYHTYLASRRQLSYTLSVERVVGWKHAKHSLLVR